VLTRKWAIIMLGEDEIDLISLAMTSNTLWIESVDKKKKEQGKYVALASCCTNILFREVRTTTLTDQYIALTLSAQSLKVAKLRPHVFSEARYADDHQTSVCFLKLRVEILHWFLWCVLTVPGTRSTQLTITIGNKLT
jgi:hypothetical protein